MKLFLNEKFIGTLILINALFTVYLCYDGPPYVEVINYLDYLIIMLFVCEATYKIFVHKKQYFKDNWNKFDFFVTATSFIMLVIYFTGLELEFLENVVVLRTLRLFRFFRIIKVVPNIDKMFSDLRKAIRVTSGILIFGFIVLLVIGVILCSMYKSVDPIDFGDPLLAIYSVFRIFSVEGWYEIPNALTENASYINATFIRMLFTFLVLFGTFVLGFIISSISDELAIDNNDKLMEKSKQLEEKIDKLTEIINKIENNNNNK